MNFCHKFVLRDGFGRYGDLRARVWSPFEPFGESGGIAQTIREYVNAHESLGEAIPASTPTSRRAFTTTFDARLFIP